MEEGGGGDGGGGHGSGGDGGGGDGIGWHGLSHAEHIEQAIWSLDIALIVDIADETSEFCKMKRRVKRENTRIGWGLLILFFQRVMMEGCLIRYVWNNMAN
uniref:Putative Proline rich extensin signature n=1 Tax=Davidia involucrata TaxID=16924 RepID=A0A5B7AXW3_DAVIN